MTTATVVTERVEVEQASAVVDKVVVVGLVITSSTTIDMMEMTRTAGRVKATVEATRAARLPEAAVPAEKRVDLAAQRRKTEKVSELLT